MRLIPIHRNSVKTFHTRAVLIGVCACVVLWMVSLSVFSFAQDAPKPMSVAKPLDVRQQFLAQVFPEAVPSPKTLWLTPAVKKDMKKILKHDYAGLRVRYWQEGAKSEKATRRVWILNEVGKYKPITVGIVVKAGAIEKIQVLEYRESHGWEVKHDFFTQQFIGATLPKHWKLDRRIDGISGATLSVRALKKLAMMSLYLDAVASAGVKS